MATEQDWEEVADLVRRTQAGDRDAADTLIRRFKTLVYSVTLRVLANPTEAEEATQDTLVHILKKIHQVRDGRAFAGWVTMVASRRAINHAARRPLAGMGDGTVADEAVEPDQLLGLCREETRLAVRRAIRQLCVMDRQALRDYYFHGLEMKEIAELRGIPIGTVKRRLHVARHRLHAVMIKRPMATV